MNQAPMFDLLVEDPFRHVLGAGVLAERHVAHFAPAANRRFEEQCRVQPNVIFESGQFTTILAMVAAGTGVSVVPEMAIEKRDGCRFLPLADAGSYRRIGTVQLKQHFRSRAHSAFLKHMRQYSQKAR